MNEINNIEKVKQFWNFRPCNVKHSDKPINTKEYYDEVEKKKYFVEPHILKFAEFEKYKNKNVLEIGCGIGTDSINFVRNGANLTTIDLSEKSVEICKKRFEIFNLNAHIICGDCEKIDTILEKQKFDLIYSFGVIHHSPEPSKIIEGIQKYCNEQTRIKIMLYSFISFKTLEAWIQYGWKFNFNFRKTIEYYAEAQFGCPVAKTYTKKDLNSLFRNFEIVSIKKDHIFPYKINDYIKQKYNKRFIFKVFPKNIFQKLESILGWHWLIELKIKNEK